ncbi:MAG: Maf family protein [Planctomycetes bacterium]|nr:Maf family protein [Planctomycetota bacterium]
MSLILASRSPERKAILAEVVSELVVEAADVDETPLPGEDVREMVLRLAKMKAEAIYRPGGSAVVAADTVVESAGVVLGKPQDEEHARAIIECLEGKTFNVHSGTYLILDDGRKVSDLSSASLEMAKMSAEEQGEYFASKVWQGRAGAFSIFHEPCHTHLLSGDIYVVRGISLSLIKKHLKEIG